MIWRMKVFKVIVPDNPIGTGMDIYAIGIARATAVIKYGRAFCVGEHRMLHQTIIHPITKPTDGLISCLPVSRMQIF